MVKTYEQKLISNIPKVYFFNFFKMFLIILPVIVPFYKELGLNMEMIFELQAVFAIVVVIFEIPSGYVADFIGRKNSLTIGSFLYASGFSFLPFASQYWHLVGIEVFIGLGVSLFSGSDVALLYDTLKSAATSSKESKKIIGGSIFYSQIGETIAALIGGALAVYSLKLPVFATAVTQWIPFFVSLTLVEPKRKKMDPRTHLENIKYIYGALFGQSRFLTLAILNIIVFGVSSLIGAWVFQAYWGSIGIPLVYFGYLWAISNLTVALTARFAHKFEKKIGGMTSVFIVGLFPVLGFLGMGLISVPVGAFFFILFQVSRGFNAVVLRDALNVRVESDMRATANSITSLGVRLLYAALGPILGFYMDNRGVSYAFTNAALVLGVVFVLVNIPLAFEARKLDLKPLNRL